MENKDFTFDISVSKKGYTSKETAKKNYMPFDWNVINTSLDNLVSYIKSGHSSCYIFKGKERRMTEFIKTNTIFFDLDYMDIPFDDFISSIGLKPSYAYTSFHYNEDTKIYKYRLIYLLDKAVTSINEFVSVYLNIADAIGIINLKAFDYRDVNQFYFGTNSSTNNFKDYITYNIYHTDDFLSININDMNKYQKIITHIKQNSKNDTLKNINCSLDNLKIDYHFDITKYKTHSDYIESNSIYYSYLPEEYFAIYSMFNGHTKEKIKITNGNRTKTLYAVGQVFKYLNPEISENELASFLNYWLNTNCVNDEDKITKKDIASLVKSIFNTEFNGKVKKHSKIKVNMAECGKSLYNEGNYSYTPIECVHFARKQKTNDEILGNYDFTTTVRENLKNLKTLGINTTYQTINNVMKRTGIDKYSEKFNIKDFILEQIDINPNTKQKDIIEMLQDKVSEITVKRMFKKLQKEKIIENKGTKKEPIWIKLIKY